MPQPLVDDATSGRLSFAVLGPVRLLRDGRTVPMRSVKSRALLALLIVNRGRPVAPGLLIDRLWGEPPPPTALASVRNLLSGLRRLLATDDRVRITTDADGYRLDTPADAVDLTVFEQCRDRGRDLLSSGDPQDAARELSRALDRWAGPALMDLAEAGHDWPERAALDETRLATIDDLIRVELRLRRYREVLIRLAPLLADRPGRESLHRARIVALQGAGRRAEAARAYLDARRILTQHTGREPGTDFHHLHARILAD